LHISPHFVLTTSQCTGGNTNQIFSLSSTPAPVSYTPPASYPTTTSASSTSAVSATTTSSAPTSTGTPFYAPYNGTQLYFNDNTRQCLTVLGGNAVPGAVASLVDCFSAVNPYIDLQLWNLTRGVTNVRLAATPSLCLDFGSTPKNGAQVKVSGCSNVPQQQFYYTADNRLAIYNGGTWLHTLMQRVLTCCRSMLGRRCGLAAVIQFAVWEPRECAVVGMHYWQYAAGRCYSNGQ
jgi:hypothetical protein